MLARVTFGLVELPEAALARVAGSILSDTLGHPSCLVLLGVLGFFFFFPFSLSPLTSYGEVFFLAFEVFDEDLQELEDLEL